MTIKMLEIKTSDIVAGSNVRSQNGNLGELQASIEEQGILQPITVQELPNGKYEIVTGHRRFAAAQKAGVPKVPCVIREVDPKDRVLQQLTENIQREDLSPLDLVQAVARFQQLTGWTNRMLSQRLGKSDAWVSECLKVARSLTKDEVTELRAAHEQPSLYVLRQAVQAKKPETRAAILQGTYHAREAEAIVNREKQQTNGVRPRSFAFRVELQGAVVSIRLRKHRTTKRELLRLLDQAKVAVSESSKLGTQ